VEVQASKCWTYINHNVVTLPSLPVELVEATVVFVEVPPWLPPLLFFLLPLLPLWRLLFLFLLLGGRDGTEGCGLGADGTVLV
jgi:hypothetical protein